MNSGKTLFAQLMEFVPWSSFARIVARYSADARISALPSTEHFRILAYAQLTWRESLRDIEVTLGANPTKLYAMGLRQAVRRSTLADANERRDWRIWADLAAVLIRRASKLYADEPLGLDVNIAGKVYALDSSTIDLCLSLFDWAPFRSTKAAIKLHTLLDLRGNIPAFIHISDGKMGDVTVLDMLPIEPGAFYIMDRGYMDFARLYKMHQGAAFFVTRAKSNLNARRVYSMSVDKCVGVICDQRVALNGQYSAKDYPEQLRRVRFKDPQTGKTLVFLTNNTSLPAHVIAQLYKSRWQVELFFKWVKQHLRIKKFLGTSQNAVKTQIWCAICTYVLIAIVKKELAVKSSLYTCLQILSVSVFEKTQVSCALAGDDLQTEPQDPAKQLILFDF
jgi:Transposase DDE domain/Domain of unknown function (DUF4372)